MIIHTFTGKKINLLSEKSIKSNFDIIDIAHSLSQLCRFNGHTKLFYSVAEHSVRMSELSNNFKLKLKLLLHDASEAYLTDIPRCIKNYKKFKFYRDLENNIQNYLYEILNLGKFDYKEIKYYDDIMLLTEIRDLMNESLFKKEIKVIKLNPLVNKIVPWSSIYAEERFKFQYYNCICRIN